MPLNIEVLLTEKMRWYQFHTGKPDDLPVGIPQLMPDGNRKIYILSTDVSDEFSTMATYDIPPEIDNKFDAIDLIKDGVMVPSSEITIKRGENYYYSVRTSELTDRTILVFSHD